MQTQSKTRVALGSLMVTAMLFATVRHTDLAPSEAKGEPARRPIVAAYVYDESSRKLADSDAANLDQLNFAFALIQNGRVSGDHWKAIDAFESYIAKHPHIYPVLSVGGWGADGFSQAAASAEGRAVFVESALALMDAHGFLGLDIDWEYPGSSAADIASSKNDRKNFTLLLKALREGLDARAAADGRARTLSVAVGGATELTENIDCAAVSALVDQFSIMTYDLQNDACASHHTPLYTTDARSPYSVDSAVRAYLAAGVSAPKLMIGAAFYGRSSTLSDASTEPLFQPAKRASSYRYYLLKEKLAAAKVAYDEKAQAAYLIDGNAFVSYDSPRSIAAKGGYVTANGLMGMMTWEYGGDANGELLQAMRDSMP